MTPEEWEIIRRGNDELRAEVTRLRGLLNDARQALPADHPLQSQIRPELGLTQEQAA